MATSLGFKESTVEISAGGRTARMTGEQFAALPGQIARRTRQARAQQAELDVEDDENLTPESLFEAMSELEVAEATHTMAKERAKSAKADEDEARNEVRRIHRAIKRQREES